LDGTDAPGRNQKHFILGERGALKPAADSFHPHKGGKKASPPKICASTKICAGFCCFVPFCAAVHFFSGQQSLAPKLLPCILTSWIRMPQWWVAIAVVRHGAANDNSGGHPLQRPYPYACIPRGRDTTKEGVTKTTIEGGEGGMDAKMGHQQWQRRIWCQRRGIGGTDDPTINKKIMMAARGGGAAAESKHFNGN
jgi:hypothetical protein